VLEGLAEAAQGKKPMESKRRNRMKYTIKTRSAFAVVLLAAVGANASLIINTTAPTADNPLSAAEAGGGFTVIRNNEFAGQTFLMPATGVSGRSQWSMTALTVRTASTSYSYEAGDQLQLYVFAWNPSTDGNDVTEWSKGVGPAGDPLDGTGMSLLFSNRYDLPASISVGSYLHFNLETPVVLAENTAYGFVICIKDVEGGVVNNQMRLATDPANSYSDGILVRKNTTAPNTYVDAVDMTFYVTATTIPATATTVGLYMSTTGQ